MSQPGPPLHHFSHSLPPLHPSPPLLNTRPASNLDPQERKHARHCKRQIGQIGERGAVGKRDVVLRGQKQACIKNIPLPERVGVQSRAEKKGGKTISNRGGMGKEKERKRTFQRFGEGAPERRERGSRGENRASILLWRYGGFF